MGALELTLIDEVDEAQRVVRTGDGAATRLKRDVCADPVATEALARCVGAGRPGRADEDPVQRVRCRGKILADERRNGGQFRVELGGGMTEVCGESRRSRGRARTLSPVRAARRPSFSGWLPGSVRGWHSPGKKMPDGAC